MGDHGGSHEKQRQHQSMGHFGGEGLAELPPLKHLRGCSAESSLRRG
jgi:hypothetical protein